MNISRYSFIFLLMFFEIPVIVFSQNNIDTLPQHKTVIAGKEYKSSKWHEWLWGSNYRNVWITPVRVKILLLDTVMGGLNPDKAGGGNQTKSLHLKNSDDKEYSLRSVDKTLGKVLPEQFRNTFIENLVNDEVSMSNPYAAATVPYLSEKAKVYHTNPTYVYLPKQPALDSFNKKFGNDLYLFEQRLSGNWKDADNLGNFKDYFDTFELLDTLNNCNNCIVDQKAFIRARLFDMFINDWDRHEGQWRWGAGKEGDKIVFTPVPQDRDQAYSKHNGVILTTAMKAGGLSYMQPFENNLENVKKFTYEERNLDRRFINEATLSDWQTIATDLQNSLTDEVIEKAIQNLPNEIYPIIGRDIIEKLKARRNHITEWATEYYNFLAKEVEIPGSKQNEEFDVRRLNSNETLVNVFGLNDQGENKVELNYSRTFKASETKEIRLFGLAGKDRYVIEGNDNAIKIKIIAGINKNSVTNVSSSNKKDDNIIVYGDKHNNIQTGRETQLHIINDTSFRNYRYNWFMYNKKGIAPSVFYSYEDRIYIGLGYKIKQYAWDKQPFASSHLVDLHYSLMQNTFSITYKALFPNLIVHSDLTLLANYDAIRWTHFFGLGNETQFRDDKNIKYYTMRTRQWLFQPALVKIFGRNSVSIFANVQGVKIINDTDRFISKIFITNKTGYDWKSFTGGGVSYSFQQLNNAVIPTKGIYFNATASGAQNLDTKSSYYLKYSGVAHIYLPLVPKFSLGIRAGAATVTGNPEFYQYASIGGPTLRGFKRDRFWGKTALYNTNDLRFISKVHTHIFNGKAGLLAFFDNGRVWMPHENSNTWHAAIGGGIIIAPFNFLYADATYGVSKKESTIQVRITTYLKEKK